MDTDEEVDADAEITDESGPEADVDMETRRVWLVGRSPMADPTDGWIYDCPYSTQCLDRSVLPSGWPVVRIVRCQYE